MEEEAGLLSHRRPTWQEEIDARMRWGQLTLREHAQRVRERRRASLLADGWSRSAITDRGILEGVIDAYADSQILWGDHPPQNRSSGRRRRAPTGFTRFYDGGPPFWVEGPHRGRP